MPTANGRITAPIGVADVSATLGIASYDVGYLCYNKHGRTNKWSARKPIRANTPGVLSELYFKESNFGLTVQDGEMSATDLNGLFKQKDWEYDPPTDGNYARLTDFNGYNHNAIRPIVVEVGVENRVAPNYPVIYAYLNGNVVGADMNISDFGMFDGANAVWGFAYRKQGTASPTYVGWSEDVGGTPTNPVTAPAMLSAIVPVGTYEVIGLIFRTNDAYYLVPNSYNIVTAKQLSVEEYLELTVEAFLDVMVGGKNTVYCSMVLTNAKNSTRSIRYGYTISRYNSAGSLVAVLSSGTSLTTTAAALTATTVSIGENGNATPDESGVYGGYYVLELSVYVDSYGTPITRSLRYDL